MKKWVGLLSLLWAGYVSAYGSVGGAKVIAVRVDVDGRGMVVFDRDITGGFATCRNESAYKNALAFGPDTGGKNVLAFALSAKATGATVTVYGDGTCSINGGAHVENWSYGILQ